MTSSQCFMPKPLTTQATPTKPRLITNLEGETELDRSLLVS